MRPGKIVHVNTTIAASDLATKRVVIPRRRSSLSNVQQNLAGPNWNGGSILTGNTHPPVDGGGSVSRISIRNNSATAVDLQVSFDGGNNFFTLAQGESFDWEVNHRFFFIKNDTALHAEVTVEVIAVVH
ncbi:MAG: hypothetical protein CMF11_06625 [Idiomarina sp.]|nr:hypothetical protein [Idiomarina sp.]